MSEIFCIVWKIKKMSFIFFSKPTADTNIQYCLVKKKSSVFLHIIYFHCSLSSPKIITNWKKFILNANLLKMQSKSKITFLFQNKWSKLKYSMYRNLSNQSELTWSAVHLFNCLVLVIFMNQVKKNIYIYKNCTRICTISTRLVRF